MRRMNLLRHTLLTAALTVMFLLPAASWAANALVVHDGTAGIEADALGNVTAKLVAAGFTVTPSVGVPGGSLATYQQIWDIRFNNTTPLTASDISTYVAYMAAGGRLYLDGENSGFATRNNSIVSLISTAGGGGINLTTPPNLEFVQTPFTGPNAVASINFLAAAGTIFPGTGVFIAKDGASGAGAGIAWGPGNLSNAPAGALEVVFDVNFLQAGADADSQKLLANLIAYLANPTPFSVTATPAPSSLILVMLGLSGALLFQMRRRTKSQAV